MSAKRITQDVIDRRRKIHQYLLSQDQDVTSKQVADALGIKPQFVGSDLRQLASYDMAIISGLKRFSYYKCKGTSLVSVYRAGPVMDESNYGKNIQLKNLKPIGKDMIPEKPSDEPSGRWEEVPVEKAIPSIVGREYKYGSGQSAVQGKKGRCSLEYV